MTDNTALLAIVIPQINREESCRLTAYLDSKNVPTIGWGRADAGVRLGMTCTQAQADRWRDAKLNGICDQLDEHLSWWRTMEPLARQAVLVEMAYQMGLVGLIAFHNTLTAAQNGNWENAATFMLASKWARTDSPARAHRESEQMRTGVVQGAA
jgi:lysozyme